MNFATTTVSSKKDTWLSHLVLPTYHPKKICPSFFTSVFCQISIANISEKKVVEEPVEDNKTVKDIKYIYKRI